MEKKVVWLVVSGGMVAALLLASCAPAAVKEAEKVASPVKEKEEVVVPKEVVPEKKGEWVKWTGKKLDGTVVEKMLEKPRYGGEYVSVRNTEPGDFDDVIPANAWSTGSTNEELITRDWRRGPAGTGEWSAQVGPFPKIGLETGLLATSWELLDDTTLVFHIRKGVHWALDPKSEASRLVGGRELTAEDVVHSLRRKFSPGLYLGLRDLVNLQNQDLNSIYVSPTDKWAVVIKVKPGTPGMVYEGAGDLCHIQPPEVIQKYRDMNDWRNVVGTGPFMLKEYVGASSLTYVRNPNYWQKDPFFPENQLPYLDGIHVLIIPDMSTQQAALRTGKIDNLSALTPEQAEPLLKSKPELEWVISPVEMGTGLYMYVNKPALPFYDIRVRRALYMAIDNYAIRDVYYGGKATLSHFPVAPIADHMDMYVPIEQEPESIRELYEYHPDKARQLLAEAGYPKGFKTEVLVANTPAEYVDLLSIIKDYWAKIGVDLKIDVRDPRVITSMTRARTYTQMLMSDQNSRNPYGMARIRAGRGGNLSEVNDPRVEKAYVMMNELYFDPPKRNQIMKELASYVKEQAWFITLPSPHKYTLWQPWLKGFYGTNWTGYLNQFSYPVYVWIDQELKKAMGR